MAPDLDQDPDEQVEIEKAVKAYYLLLLSYAMFLILQEKAEYLHNVALRSSQLKHNIPIQYLAEELHGYHLQRCQPASLSLPIVKSLLTVSIFCFLITNTMRNHCDHYQNTFGPAAPPLYSDQVHAILRRIQSETIYRLGMNPQVQTIIGTLRNKSQILCQG